MLIPSKQLYKVKLFFHNRFGFGIAKINNENPDRLDLRKYVISFIGREKGLKDCKKMNDFRIMTPHPSPFPLTSFPPAIQRNAVTYQRSRIIQAIIREYPRNNNKCNSKIVLGTKKVWIFERHKKLQNKYMKSLDVINS